MTVCDNRQANVTVQQTTGAHTVKRGDIIQSLWSGYGEIVRYALQGAPAPSAILKHVIFPSERNHPRGWNNNISHQRKVKSYQVEMAWYQTWAQRCDASCRVPQCYIATSIGDEHLLVLEDLDAAGFPVRKTKLTLKTAQLCLTWLANFHATFMGDAPNGLWTLGTYWHLATRPDELSAMKHDALQQAAPILDKRLNTAQFQTLLHGDAKVANFCFSHDATQVAAVDFQYVGGGCGMKDVAYFIGSCLGDNEQELYETVLLDHYFSALQVALRSKNKSVDFIALEQEWRTLFPIAQTDFYRFLVGWMPSHWKINDYNKRVALEVLGHL